MVYLAVDKKFSGAKTMWKKLFILFSTVACAAVLAAVPGDIPGESKTKLEWINCAPMPLGKLDPEKHPHIPALRAVVFLYTRADESDSMVAMLENARRGFNGKVMIALITPDNVPDAAELQSRHRESRLRLAVDMERKP
jgi:hypothetical protein